MTPRSPEAAEALYRHWVPRQGDALVSMQDQERLARTSLFQRLLAGHDPLPHPPPRSHGGDWYAPLDAPGIFPVHLGFPRKGLTRWALGESLEFHLNQQSEWALRHANPAAMAWMALCADAEGLPAETLWSQCTPEEQQHWAAWAERAWAILAQGPCWHVQWGSWPIWRVYAGQTEAAGREDSLRRLRPPHPWAFDWGPLTDVEVTVTEEASWAALQADHARLSLPESRTSTMVERLERKAHRGPPRREDAKAWLRGRLSAWVLDSRPYDPDHPTPV